MSKEDKIKAENTEIEDQPHKMWAEGTCDIEPSQLEVAGYMLEKGWIVNKIEIWFDKIQGFYRWNCDLKEKI